MSGGGNNSIGTVAGEAELADILDMGCGIVIDTSGIMPRREGGSTMALEEELKFYEGKKEELLQYYKGQFALIKGSELLGTFTTQHEAFQAGVKALGNQPFLIKEVKEIDDVLQYPALVVGMISAHS